MGGNLTDVPYEQRFKHYVGFVSPPASCDYSAQQFLDLCDDRVAVIQNMSHYPGAGYGSDLGDAERRLEHLKDGIAGLRDASVDVVAQFGGYWSLPYAPDPNTARRLERMLSEQFGLIVLLNWTAIVDALRHLGADRIVLTTGYYRPAWTAASIAFLESAGFEILWVGDLIEQGIVPDQQAKMKIEASTRWDYPDEIVRRTCIDAAGRAPECDAICQTGAGMRTSYIVESVESETGKPLVATDIAIHWAVMQVMGIHAKPGYGQLLASTV